MRIGLIGAGRWGAVHREALASVGTPVAAVLTGTDVGAERVEAAWGVPAGTDEAAFLARDLDAAVVCSPNHLHAAHADACLRAGLHVLVEKPLALTPSEGEALLAVAAERNRVLAVGHEMRAFSWAREAHRLLQEGALGAPRPLLLRLWRRPHRAGAGGWKSDPAKLGSPVLEEPIHYLDLARWWLGDPTQLQAFATSRSGREASHENLDVRLVFGGGAQALVSRSVAAWGHRVDVALVGDEGAYRAVWEGDHDADPAPRCYAVLHRGGERETPAESVPLRAASGHAFDVPTQDRAFLAACAAADGDDERARALRGDAAGPADAAGRPVPFASGADGLAAVRLCLAVERSLQEGEARLTLDPPGPSPTG